MGFYGRVLKPQFTDLAVVVGPHVRWVEHDYEDLERFAPEVLMGYRVRLMTVDSVLRGGAHGMHIEKIVFLDGPEMQNHRAERAARELYYGQVRAEFPKFERYRVHRGYDSVVQEVPLRWWVL